MNQGYIKLYRKSIDSQVFQNPHLWKLWTLCLMKANHKEAWVSVDHIIEPIKILPGQFITGRYSLHKEYYPKATKKQKSALTVWRWLLFLEKVGNLSIKTNNKYSIVTIINWETYQGDKKQNEQVNEQQMNNKRTTDEQQMNTNKNVKNVKKKEIYKEKKVFINYGEYVRLTETQYSALSETYSEPVLKSKIEDINNYCASHNKSYKDYSAVVRSWMKREGFIQPFDWSKYTDEELMPILKERPELCKEAQIKRPTALFLSQTMT